MSDSCLICLARGLPLKRDSAIIHRYHSFPQPLHSIVWLSVYDKSLQESWTEERFWWTGRWQILLRSVFEKPNQPLSRARRRMCYSVSDLQPAALRRNCTEHDPGYLHAATRWTHAAAALLSARLTGMWRPVGTECLCMISMKKKDVHFDSVSATSVTVKYLLNTYSFALSIYLYLYIFKRKSTKLYFLGEMFTSVEFVNLSTLQIGAVVFSLKHKRGAVIAKNVKLPPRLSYSLL